MIPSRLRTTAIAPGSGGRPPSRSPTYVARPSLRMILTVPSPLSSAAATALVKSGEVLSRAELFDHKDEGVHDGTVTLPGGSRALKGEQSRHDDSVPLEL